MSLIDRVREPAYTGRNRCWPCTVVNVLVVALATLVAAAVSGPLAIGVLLVGLGLVALRGYVVPGTPRFGPRVAAYLPVSFGHDVGPATDGGAGATGSGPAARESDPLTAGVDGDVDGERVATALLEAGVVVPRGDAIDLSDAFAAEWTAEMERLRELDDESLAAAVADAAPFEGEARALEGGFALEGPGGSVFLSRARAIADAGAVRALADGYDLPASVRVHATDPLRTLVPECPTTGGPVVESTVGNCCGGPGGAYGSPDQRVLICEGTEEVLFAFDPIED